MLAGVKPGVGSAVIGLVLAAQAARADEGGVSFWLPFGVATTGPTPSQMNVT